MPISKREFHSIDDESGLDLSPDTTQGTLYRFLRRHADSAYRQRELIDQVDVPAGSVGPTLSRLESHGLVDHRGHFWSITDERHAVESAVVHSHRTAAELDGGFSDEAIDAWMNAAVEPIDDEEQE